MFATFISPGVIVNLLILSIIYSIFFLSGAAALIYQVVWIRSLSLVFGGSHLAVATVLTVFMTGLAVGGYVFGKRISGSTGLLKLYGVLELGIALFALLFMLLMKLYPPVYTLLAQLFPDSPLYLSAVRIIFAALAIIGPTTLMGGTLPVLSGLVADISRSVDGRLPFLYGFNTFGAVVGAAVAGFVLLRQVTVTSTMLVAVALNIFVAVLALLLHKRVPSGCNQQAGNQESSGLLPADQSAMATPCRLVLWGIGVSGFCALGYEILWTRILGIVVGASVYGFTIMLVAFLTGISAGSAVYGMVTRLVERRYGAVPVRLSIALFGLVQVLIGASALAVTAAFIHLPVNKPLLMKYFLTHGHSMFEARQWANIALSLGYMFVPAFLMGVAFPLAGRVHAASRQRAARAVGEILAFNTVGAIIGSALCGFVLIYLVGIERSLQMLILVNIGFGLLVMFSLAGSRAVNRGVVIASLVALSGVYLFPGIWSLWDVRWLAIYRTNELEAYNTPQSLKNSLANTQVLYYGEGAQAIVSSVKTGSYQNFITNGRTESSNTPVDLQCVYTLGHLPMLLAKNPRTVFVLGTGAGMTLGATSVYPSVEKITLVEIEPKVLGVARTFARYNHNVLDNPKLKVVFNDGRNYLMTTREKFDVITADPVHPWFSGAGYLYTSEYFKLAAEHLNPGGIICQWLPIYELTNDNLRSVVRTFRENFKYTMIWLTQYDIELVGSNTPIILDEAELARRMAIPEVAGDLTSVKMGNATDFLSYFLMGSEGARRYSQGAAINTDDNVYLEFSAPLSVGNTGLVAENIAALSAHRESILPYLVKPGSLREQQLQAAAWNERERAAQLKDRLHAVYYRMDKEFDYITLMRQLRRQYPDYAPYQLMYDNYRLSYRD